MPPTVYDALRLYVYLNVVIKSWPISAQLMGCQVLSNYVLGCTSTNLDKQWSEQQLDTGCDLPHSFFSTVHLNLYDCDENGKVWC